MFAWRKAHRERRLGVGGFVPAVIVPEPPEGVDMARGRMEVVSANGRRVIVYRDVDVDALLRLIQGLETLQ